MNAGAPYAVANQRDLGEFMRLRIARLATVVLVATVSALPLGAVAASAGPAMPPGMAGTLKANPGSVRIDENTVLTKSGVTVMLPWDGEAGTQAVTQCVRGWLCAWVDINFEGANMNIPQGTYVKYWEWYFNPRNNREVGWFPSNPPGGWTRFSYNITSVYNNTDIAWTPLHSSVLGNYYAQMGHPIAYVGAYWNDYFEDACAC
jgi:hypothetical protein